MISSRSLSIAAAVAMALGAGSAHALNFATTNAIASAAPVAPALNPPNVLVVAGASAMRLSFLQLLNQDVCQAGTLDVYRASPTANQDFRAYSCHTVAAGAIATTLGGTGPNGAADKDIVVLYRSEGGSAWGPYSVASENALGAGFNGITGLNLGAGTTCNDTSGVTTLDGVSVRVHECALVGTYALATDSQPTGTKLVNTELGTSDVEPKLFTDTNNPASVSSRFSNAANVVTALKSLAAQQAFGQVFNVIGYNGAAGTAVSDEVTNLKSGEVTGIFSGAIVDWCQISSLAANASCIAGDEHPITVVRREPGSGTQVGAGVQFNRVGCGDSWSFVTDTGEPDDFVVEAGATGVLETTVRDTPDAIGINIVKSPNPGGTKSYTIDGVAATRENAAALLYPYAFEATLTKANATLLPPTTLKLALADGIISLSRSVSRVPNNISVFAIPGIGGNIAGTTGTLTQPVALGTRSGQSCRPFKPL